MFHSHTQHKLRLTLLTSAAGIYRASMGNFNEYFALNTTASNVAYFITGDLPQRSTNRSNWLRIAFQLGDFAPIVRKLTSETSQSSESVIIVDSSQALLTCTPNFLFHHTQSKKENVEKFNAFKNAGADLTVVTPALSSAKEGPVELTVKVLEQLSKTAVTTTDSVFVDGEYVKFTGANFLRLIHKVSMAMSAFPLPIDTDTRVRHTETVLYDGIVMVKSRATSKVVLFRIFDSLSGFIWLCVFASLLVVAIIFFIIKIVNDWQTRELGTVPDDQDTSLFTRFLTVIFRNFSAVLLAKMILKPKQTSLRVLYQSYWMASILFVATYAASLAEQRFVVRNTVMPFNSLDGLLRNSMNYRWIFLQNSSVVWKIQVSSVPLTFGTGIFFKQSRDAVLRDLWIKAEKEWPKEMIVMSVAEASDRISNDDHLILIASRLEATQILSEECNLEKSGPVEYLYGLGFLLSGDDAFANRLTQQISSLSDEHVFTAIESRALGIGDCPVSWEKINMQKKPFSLKELGGLFIIVLVGLIIAFIVAAIEFAIESFPMYRQWKRVNFTGTIRFGETYPGEVLNVQDDGIWIRLLDKESTAFVDVSHIKTTRGHDGRVHLELGSYVKATYLGNDPCTANPIFNVTEEKTFKPDVAEAVPPNNQPSGQ
ncbi:unnamed protein product [Mesocestoides corti]|uniref:S1 motif domain-containing protein n=1 Tax=Mesocestoides corti TaxID=53468 RepID=A0A3P6GA61_MESCO|nr:unnamed protein product [Mesocestoides corti]